MLFIYGQQESKEFHSMKEVIPLNERRPLTFVIRSAKSPNPSLYWKITSPSESLIYLLVLFSSPSSSHLPLSFRVFTRIISQILCKIQTHRLTNLSLWKGSITFLGRAISPTLTIIECFVRASYSHRADYGPTC